MESDDFEAALAALPEGYSEGIYEGRRYGERYAAPEDRMAKSKRVKVIHTAKVASLVGRHQ